MNTIAAVVLSVSSLANFSLARATPAAPATSSSPARATSATPPDSLSLQYCYRRAYESYPTVRNIEMQQEITDLNTKIANSAYFPQIDVSGKATYQTEVTEFSTPGGGGPPPVSKDQYEASVDVTQTIFNGGATGIRKQLERAKGKQEVSSVKVDLHQIREQIDQVYFGILLSRQQAKTIDLLMENLRNQLSTIRSKVENGVLLPSQQHILEAELINAQKDSAGTYSNIKAGYRVLSELLDQKISPVTYLQLPESDPGYRSLELQRAEYELFNNSRATLEQQRKLQNAQKWPRLAAFGTAAYGRPGLNFLNNDFHDYYIVGLRLQWSFWDFINADRSSKALRIQQQKITQNKRAFSRQLQASLDRIVERISSIRENIKRDEKIISLREQIVEENASQLRNGVITATEYVKGLTNANQARLSLFISRVQLSQAQSDYKTTIGKPITN